VVFFGMRCAFSAPPLEALIQAGYDLPALVLPGRPGAEAVVQRVSRRGATVGLPTAGQHPLASIDRLAVDADIPVLEVSDLKSGAALNVLQELEPDVIAVACFRWRIPSRVRVLPRLGSLNVHPSLLPRWRGPEPLFWTFKAGDLKAGTTVHLMDDGFDTGPIVRQEHVPLASGVDGLTLEHELAELGGRLLVEAIDGLAMGRLTPAPQDDALATTAPMPNDADLMVDLNQPARRVFEFVRGVAPLWGPLPFRSPNFDEFVLVDGTLAFDPDATQDAPIIRDGAVINARCNPGVVRLAICESGGCDALTPVAPV